MFGILSVQFSPKLSDKNYNLKVVEKHIEENFNKGIDLVVIPEFFSTGIDYKSFKESPEEENGGGTIKTLQNYAKKYKTNIVAGTVITKINNNLYNTSFAIDRTGKILNKYNKIHLYGYLGGNENQRITPGDKYVVVGFDFAKIGICVCFDIRYPLQFKCLSQMGAEIIVIPTFWTVENQNLKMEKDLWISMNKIRAYDNSVYIISSNAVGSLNNKITAIGNSCIVSPFGEILQNAEEKSTAIFENIDLNEVRKFKKEYPISEII